MGSIFPAHSIVVRQELLTMFGRIDWNELVYNLIAEAIGIGVLLFITWIVSRRFFGKSRHLYRLFGYKSLKNDGLIFVLPETAKITGQYYGGDSSRPFQLIGYADFVGFSFLFSFVQVVDVKSETRIKMANDSERGNNLFCVGGPGPNGETKHFTDRVKTKFQFVNSRNEWTILDTIHDRPHQANNSYDYGLVWKYRNPWGSQSSILVCAGIWEQGTLGACYYFFQNYRNLSKQYGSGDFELIIGIDREVGYRSTKLVASYP